MTKKHCSKETSDSIAESWLRLCDKPDDRVLRNGFSDLLDELLKEKVPRKDFLRGREEELVQSAHLLLLGRYLAGNRALLSATSSRHVTEIRNQIYRSSGAALRDAMRQLCREISQEKNRYEYHGCIEDIPTAICVHPAMHMHRYELPFEAQRELLFMALQNALARNQLSPFNATTALTMAAEGLSQAEMARRLGISRSAIHQRLTPVRRYLAEEIEKMEFPTHE